jgi:glyoxylase-like metal-dependent hydrolase (beta-lactamase superfamily II)
MKEQLRLLLGISALMVGPATAQQGQPNPNQAAAKALLQAADKAIGASRVKSWTSTGTGRRGYPGQQFARGDLPQTDLKSFTYTVDYPSRSAKWEYVRVQGNNPPIGGGAGFPVRGEQKFTEVVNGNFAWNVNPQGQPAPINPRDAANRQLRVWLNPAAFIQAALAAPNAAATDRYYARQNRTVKVVGFSIKVCDRLQPQCTRQVTGEFNDQNLLERTITWFADPVMGDEMVEFRWSDYRDVGGGVKLPFHVHAHIGDHPLIPGGHNFLDFQASEIKVNLADAAQPVPDAVRSAPPVTTDRVVATTLAAGVVLMGGGSHNSIAVEFKDYVVMIEAPLDQERSLAVISETKKTFPNKPIRYVVNTHNHFDHLGGVRTYVAEGATIITDERNKNFYERVVLAPQQRTLLPDRLSQRPFAPTGPGMLEVQGFTDNYTISDGNQIIEVYHVERFNHSDNMAIVYLPKAKIVINADMYGPPAAGGTLPNVNANAVVLYRNIMRLKLDVAQHVPIHGNPGPQADFARIVAVAYVQAQNIIIRPAPSLDNPLPIPAPPIAPDLMEKAMTSCSERLRNNLIERAAPRSTFVGSLRVEILSVGGDSYTINLSGPSIFLSIGSPDYWEELSVQAFAFRPFQDKETVGMRIEINRSRKNKSGGDPQPNPRLWADMRPEDEGPLGLFQNVLSSQIRSCLQDKGL